MCLSYGESCIANVYITHLKANNTELSDVLDTISRDVGAPREELQ